MLDLTRFTRPQLCARITVLTDCPRNVLLQAAVDGRQPLGPSHRAIHGELEAYETALEQLDAAALAGAA